MKDDILAGLAFTAFLFVCYIGLCMAGGYY